MKLLDAKRNIEQYISTNYSTTDIHWAGMKFDTTTRDEWVYFQYRADIISDSGLSNTDFKQSGMLQVSIVAKSPFRCNEIGDVIIDMFKGVKVDAIFASRVLVTGEEYVSDLDRTVLELDVSFTTY